MRNRKMIVLGLATLVLVTAQGYLADAKAGIRVVATLHTPGVRIRVQNWPADHYQTYVRRHAPLHRHGYLVGPQDRRVAHRLAWYTGASQRRLIQLRRQGYGWFQIGHCLELPRPVVRAAMNGHSWKRFLRHQRQLAGHGMVRYKERRVAFNDDYHEYDD